VVITTITSGQEQTHIGAELSFSAKPVDGFKFRGFVSVGDWQYIGEVISFDRNEDTNAISNETEVDVDGGKVGDAAQFTAGLGIDVNLAERLSFDADWRMYDNLYANVGAVKENLELPSYDLVDMGVSYKMLLGKNRDKSLAFRANVNNVFSEVYLSDLRTANTAEAGDETWNGINVNNQGYFGFGRTWNLSLKYKF
jgi:outer membrane receptor protein involved in Fe transport